MNFNRPNYCRVQSGTNTKNERSATSKSLSDPSRSTVLDAQAVFVIRWHNYIHTICFLRCHLGPEAAATDGAGDSVYVPSFTRWN